VIARLNLGGPAQQAALLSGRRLDPERYETLLVHGSLPAGEGSMADLAEREAVRREFLPSLVQPVAPAKDTGALAKLARIVRRFRPDIVHTHTAKAGFIGRAAALTVRPRPVIVHTYHGHVLEGYFGAVKSGTYRRLERALGRFSDALVGVSEATVDDLVRLGVAARERFRIIPLGLDLSGYERPGDGDGAALRRELHVGEEEALVAYVGRVAPIKRLDVLVRAVAHARDGGARLHLAITGDGDTRPDLEQLAAGLGIGDRVHFLGYRRDLPNIFAASDIAAISSANEGTPVSLIEAGAAGVPAVATDVGGVADVVKPDTGILVPAGDGEALGDAIARLAADPKLRRGMGAAARVHVLERYDAERLVSDIDRLYAELIGERAIFTGSED
jgi:glycosyltransferase involved in cell wall biosynthesis